MQFTDKAYKPSLFYDELIKVGVPAEAVRVKSLVPEGLVVTILRDDPAGSIDAAIRQVADEHDASQLSYNERQAQDRETVEQLVDLDENDIPFFEALTDGFTQAENSALPPLDAYNALRGFLGDYPKHKGNIHYWYDMEYGIDPDGTLTDDQKRAYVKCVRRYYATKLAPALVVWLMR